jgi:hypothetical protein
MQVRYTPPYTCQANPVERVSRVLKTMIACYLSDKHVDWDLYVPEFMFAVNTTAHSATLFTHAYLNYGRKIAAPMWLDPVPGGQCRPTRHCKSPGQRG